MTQIQTKNHTLSHIDNNCNLKNAKSPNLVLNKKNLQQDPAKMDKHALWITQHPGLLGYWVDIIYNPLG